MSDNKPKRDEKPSKSIIVGKHGGVRTNQRGRPPKADEIKLIEKLSPLDDTAFTMLSQLVEDGNLQAIKLFFEYRFGKPKQIVAIEQKKDEGEQVFVIGGKTIKL